MAAAAGRTSHLDGGDWRSLILAICTRCKQLNERNAKGFRDNAEVEDRGISLAAFDGTDVSSVQAATLRKHHLR